MKRVLFLFTLLLCWCSCSVDVALDRDSDSRNSGELYFASIEDADTKTYIDSDLKVHWTAGDRISVFSSTANNEYMFTGNTGDREGTFALQGEKKVGETTNALYALYPYSEDVTSATNGAINFTFPYSQQYVENSFALGSNVMLAFDRNWSTESLHFVNLCGFMVFKLYGKGVVKGLLLSGNANERLSGPAFAGTYYEYDGAMGVYSSGINGIYLDCGEGVELGDAPESAKEFWFSLPPLSFAKGFTLAIYDTNDHIITKATTAWRTVSRNTRYTLAPLEVNFEQIPDGDVKFEDDVFRAYCVENFDQDGDGMISFAEAAIVTNMTFNTDHITTLKGIENFTELQVLSCTGSIKSYDMAEGRVIGNGLLTSIDVSQNKKLITLCCDFNQIEELDLSENTELKGLTCSANKLRSFDLNAYPQLLSISCAWNLIEELNVKNHPSIVGIGCSNNKLTTLDASGISQLYSLDCSCNKLTSVNVDNDVSLNSFVCYSNKLESLSVSTNTELVYLGCYTNKLRSLDVSNNLKLTTLACYDNPYLTVIWLSTNQNLENFVYDSNIAKVKYK